MGEIKAICISERRGTAKHPVETARLLEGYGIERDAHGGNWHRQVSLLGLEKIEDFRKRGAEVEFGAFGENIVAEGIDFRCLPVGSWIGMGETVLELTQIGKECHHGCAIFQQMGRCIMPHEGIFARVLQGGEIHEGDEIQVLEP